MNNIIIADNNDLIGYKRDLIEYFNESIKLALELNNYDEISYYVEVLNLLKTSDDDKLLIISENNGQGLSLETFNK